ncbi:MAG: carboxymuconolactone decarboxylase family protein [Clostridium sp.]|nr:carboxymuconolactone decarboxylase family protein [Bacteroides sp.]MCM1197966.1 carboxymuconolactone decarboxylase family protein [Clostridium sp.]
MKKYMMIAATMTLGCILNAQNMENILTPQQQSLSAIACLEAKGDIVKLETAIGNGFDNGLTVSQIKEALSHLYAYTGFPRSLNGLNALQRVIAAREAKGQATPEGVDASPVPAGFDALASGTEIQTKVSGRPFDYTFAPATDYYLKAHLFGDIFARDNLSFQERELVTVSALSALKGAEPQLMSHIRGAQNMGLGDNEIKSIPLNLAASVGESEAYRAASAIAEVYGEKVSDIYGERFKGRPVENMVFPKGEVNPYGKYFTGESYLAPLAEGPGAPSNVTFEPGCRNNWHIHHNCVQTLICVGGFGWYQEWGQPARCLKPGDVVCIPEGVKHWHGAAADSWFQHIAYSVPTGPEPSNEWLEPVDGAHYDSLHAENQQNAPAF